MAPATEHLTGHPDTRPADHHPSPAVDSPATRNSGAAVWLMRVAWLALPFAAGDLLASAVADYEPSLRTVCSVGLWGVWTAVALLCWLPHDVTLALLRIWMPAGFAAVCWALAAGGEGGGGSWSDTLPAAITAGVAAVVCLSPAVGGAYISALNHPSERRFLLRPPVALLLGPIFFAWVVAVGGALVGPLLLAAGRWLAGGIALAAGWALALKAHQSLLMLARRWLVFVPAGIVVCDTLALGVEARLIETGGIGEIRVVSAAQRRSQAAGDARGGTRGARDGTRGARGGAGDARNGDNGDVGDLTLGSLGAALDFHMSEPCQLPPRGWQRLRRQHKTVTSAPAQNARIVRLAPTLLSQAIAEVRRQMSATSHSDHTSRTEPQPATPEHTPEQLLAQLSLDEKCAMLHGRDKWEIAGCLRLGIPDWTVSDGPSGVRGRQMAVGLLLPGAVSLAASWDTGLIAQVGGALAQECHDRRVQMLLAPTVNLQRLPTWGRVFESFSEDPLLTSCLAVAYIQALQAADIGACVKHFVGNEQEVDRFSVSSEMDERTLREVYLAPFEAAVKQADVRAVMGSYNRVAGELTCESSRLLDEILRQEWGFDGVVVSDWSALKNIAEPLEAGVNLDMPGGGYWSMGALAAAVRGDRVDEALVDRRLLDVLRFLEWCGRLQGESELREEVVVRPEHGELARRCVAAGAVLIHNRGGLLPLGDGESAGTAGTGDGSASAPKSIALIGPHALRPCPSGGGAAEVGLQHSANLAECLREHLGHELELSYAQGVSLDRSAPPLSAEWLGEAQTTLEFFEGRDITGEPQITLSHQPMRFFIAADPNQPDPNPDVIRLDWPNPDWEYISVRQRLRITVPAGAGGRWYFCGAGASEVRLLLGDGERDGKKLDGKKLDGGPRVSGENPRELGGGLQELGDSLKDGFSLEPGFWGCGGVAELVGGATYELVLEHTSKQQHQRMIHSCVFARPVGDEGGGDAGSGGGAGSGDGVDGAGLADETNNLDAAAAAAGRADLAVVVVGTTPHWEAENFDRPTLALPAGQDELVRRCAAANPNTVVVINSGAPVLMPWRDQVAAVLTVWFPGQAGAAGLADVLCGRADPGGRSPITWPGSDGDIAARANSPASYPGIDGKVVYEEGVLVGHRWFDHHGVKPAVAFGHGLSYAEFEWDSPRLSGEFPDLAIEVEVTNVSRRAGSEVVQCYVGLTNAGAGGGAAGSPLRPPQWLAGFAKLHLSAGESATATIQLNHRTFACWDVSSGSWKIPGSDSVSGASGGGNYVIHLARSSADRVFSLDVEERD